MGRWEGDCRYGTDPESGTCKGVASGFYMHPAHVCKGWERQRKGLVRDKMKGGLATGG